MAFDPYKGMAADEVAKLKRAPGKGKTFPKHEVRNGKVYVEGSMVEVPPQNVARARQRHGRRVAELDRQIADLQATRDAHAAKATELDQVEGQIGG